MLQDGFVKVFTKIHTYSGTGSFGGWIRRIFVTTALEYLRLNKRDNLKHGIDFEEIKDLVAHVDASAVEKLSADELLNCIIDLPEGYRTVFNLLFGILFLCVFSYFINSIKTLINLIY